MKFTIKVPATYRKGPPTLHGDERQRLNRYIFGLHPRFAPSRFAVNSLLDETHFHFALSLIRVAHLSYKGLNITIACACRVSPWFDAFALGLTHSALSRDADWRHGRYHKENISRKGFVLIQRLKEAGWRKKNAAAKMYHSLSLIAACTPSLTHTIPDDRGLQRADKDCNCCHYIPCLMQAHSHQHKKGHDGGETHYLSIVVGKARGRSITESAHRLLCYAWHGPPSSHQPVVRHLCNNIGGTCVNPYHLQWNTVKANNVDVHALIKERAQVLAARALHGGAAQIHQR